jgi:sugar phosphate isomerase/epimerase
MPFTIGVQSVVYADRPLDALLDDAAAAGIDAVELFHGHLSLDADTQRREAVLEYCSVAGVEPCGYGVVDLEAPADAECAVATAAALGVDYVSVSYDPDDEAITAALVAAAEASDVLVGLHNYSTVHYDDTDAIFSSVADIERVLAAHPSPALGACLDLGHFLVMGADPADVITALGPDTVAVHCKDTSEDELETAPGDGTLDLAACVDLLATHTDGTIPLVIEYELPPERATAALETTAERLRDAISRAD